jgi:hypothetical protein
VAAINASALRRPCAAYFVKQNLQNLWRSTHLLSKSLLVSKSNLFRHAPALRKQQEDGYLCEPGMPPHVREERGEVCAATAEILGHQRHLIRPVSPQSKRDGTLNLRLIPHPLLRH